MRIAAALVVLSLVAATPALARDHHGSGPASSWGAPRSLSAASHGTPRYQERALSYFRERLNHCDCSPARSQFYLDAYRAVGRIVSPPSSCGGPGC